MFSYVFFSLPTFWLGLMFIFIFAVGLHWFPARGIVTTRDWPPFNTPQYWAAFGEAPLKAIADIGGTWSYRSPSLVLVNIAGDCRFVRASMLESLNQDYVRTAKAKGLGGRAVIGKHAFRNAMLPVVTNVALELPFLVSGAIVTETIFSWPGLGLLFIDWAARKDYFLLMGLILLSTVVHPARQPPRRRASTASSTRASDTEVRMAESTRPDPLAYRQACRSTEVAEVAAVEAGRPGLRGRPPVPQPVAAGLSPLPQPPAGVHRRGVFMRS